MRTLFSITTLCLFALCFSQCSAPGMEAIEAPQNIVLPKPPVTINERVDVELPVMASEWSMEELQTYLKRVENKPISKPENKPNQFVPDCSCELESIARLPNTQGYRMAPYLGYYLVFPDDIDIINYNQGLGCEAKPECVWAVGDYHPM